MGEGQGPHLREQDLVYHLSIQGGSQCFLFSAVRASPVPSVASAKILVFRTASARLPLCLRYDSAVHAEQLWKRLGSLTTVCRRPEATTTNVDGGAVRHNKYKYRRRLVCLR